MARTTTRRPSSRSTGSIRLMSVLLPAPAAPLIPTVRAAGPESSPSPASVSCTVSGPSWRTGDQTGEAGPVCLGDDTHGSSFQSIYGAPAAAQQIEAPAKLRHDGLGHVESPLDSIDVGQHVLGV